MTLLDQAVTEKDFQQQIVDLARLLRWRVYHTHDSRPSAPGFPDLVLVKGRQCIFAEVKTETGRITVEQKKWMDALAEVRGHSVIVWRPSCWRDIEAALKGGPA